MIVNEKTVTILGQLPEIKIDKPFNRSVLDRNKKYLINFQRFLQKRCGLI